jgi:hypothetical protein
LYALAFAFVLPQVNGVSFAGGFWPNGLLFGLAFFVGCALFEGMFAIGYVILSYLLSVVGRLIACLSFWLVPTAVLLLLAHFFPHNLSLGHGAGGIIASLILSGIWMLLN